jgi:hypothetical protein
MQHSNQINYYWNRSLLLSMTVTDPLSVVEFPINIFFPEDGRTTETCGKNERINSKNYYNRCNTQFEKPYPMHLVLNGCLNFSYYDFNTR